MASVSSSMDKSWAINDIKTCMPLVFKLDLTYDAWCELFKSYCSAYGVIDHIQDSNPNVHDDPEWNRIDSIVKLWIYKTINRSYQELLITSRNTTARQVWINFEAIIFNNRLKNIDMGDSSITDYCNRIKSIADHLDNIGHTVPEGKLAIYTLDGLPSKFEYIASVIREQKSPMPSFVEIRSMLLREESRMSNIIKLLKNMMISPHIIHNHEKVLGNKGYDRSDDTMVDSGGILGMIFGSHLFEDYIGKLYLAPKMKVEEKISLRKFQKKREVKLIAILKKRLQPFVKGQTAKFVNSAKKEARRLSQSFYSEVLLHTIGYIYTSEAARELDKYKLFMVPFLAECVRGICHWMKLDSSAISGHVSLLKIYEPKKLNNSPQIMKVVEDKLDDIDDSLWQMIVIDIEETLYSVCRSLFKDPKVSKDEMKQRAIGMKKLGMILQGA